MDGFTFSTKVRVRFADTDAQGIAHNSAYVVWFEVARVEYLRTYAGGYQSLRDEGIEALVLESNIRYLVPAKFDDVLHVHTRCRDIRGARFRYEYEIERESDGTLLAEGWTTHACVDAATFRPTRIPAWLVEAMERAESSSATSSSS
jgi:acyl-CoA thioester hydrolase